MLTLFTALLGAVVGSTLTIAYHAIRDRRARLRALIEELAASQKQIENLAGLSFQAHQDHVEALLRCVIGVGQEAVLPNKEMAVSLLTINEQYRLMVSGALCDNYSLGIRAVITVPKRRRRELLSEASKLDLNALAFPRDSEIQMEIASPADAKQELERLRRNRKQLSATHSEAVRAGVLTPLSQVRRIVEETLERRRGVKGSGSSLGIS